MPKVVESCPSADDGGCSGCILSMPLDIMLMVLHEFLGDHKTISALDVACSQSCRPSLLAVLQHPVFRLTDLGPSSKPRMKNYTNWLNTRQVRLHKIKVRKCNALMQSALDPLVLGSVKEAEFEYMLSTGKLANCYHVLLGKLTSLRKVSSPNRFADFTPLAGHPSLPLQCIHGYLANDCLRQLVSVFYDSLQEVILPTSWSESAFPVYTIAQCKRLTKLSLPDHDLSEEDLIILLDSLPLLRDLSFYTTGIFRGTELLDDDTIAELAPRFQQLDRLSFNCGFSNQGLDAFNSILTACPQLQELVLLAPVTYKVTGNECALTVRWWQWGDDWRGEYGQQVRFAACLRTCPVPIAELDAPSVNSYGLREIAEVAGFTLRKLTFDSYNENWSERVINDLLSSCKVLNSLGWGMAERLTDQRLHSMLHTCPHLHELHIGHGKQISDLGMAGALMMCGPRLTKLSLVECAKVSQHTLNVITRHCTNLQELALLQTSIKVPHILASIILPDELKSLRRLRVSTFVYKAIMESGNQVEKTRFARCLCKA